MDHTQVSIHLCVPEDQSHHLPKRNKAPDFLPRNAPLPRQGDVIYLSAHSAWGVQLVIHLWHAPDRLTIEVWLEHVGATRPTRPSGYYLTQ
jgi:hypothetical protein